MTLLYKSSDTIPVSGIYRVIHAQHRLPHEVTLIAGQLSQFGKEDAPETVVPRITQEMLAEMVGTTRARVSFFMNRFRKMGFIHYNGGLQVHSSLLNVVLHD